MPDLDALAAQISAELAPVLKRLEADTVARIAAAQVRDAMIDRTGALILTFGDGSTRNLGTVVGADGVDGKDGAPGLDGNPGADGKDGAPGLDGKDGVDGKDGLDGKDGVDGAPGEVGEKGLDGLVGPQGPPGPEIALLPLEARLDVLEGRSVANAMIDRAGDLVLGFRSGETLVAGKVIGTDGIDGKDGTDGKPGLDGKAGEIGPPGLGFDDLHATLHDDGRTLVLAFVRGEQVKSFELLLPAMVYRGVYDPDRHYGPGDTVTFGGSAWVCNAPTSAKPGETEKTWTLAVKRGRDGKDFAGPQVKVGAR